MTKVLPSRERLMNWLSYDPVTGIFTRTKSSGNAMAGQRADRPHKTQGRVYRVVRIFGGVFYAHRLAFVMMGQGDPGPMVDHDNRDTEDNHWRNLSKSDNARNQLNARHNRSEPHVYPGPVSFQVRVLGRYYGCRRTFEEAVKLRDEVYSSLGL